MGKQGAISKRTSLGSRRTPRHPQTLGAPDAGAGLCRSGTTLHETMPCIPDDIYCSLIMNAKIAAAS